MSSFVSGVLVSPIYEIGIYLDMTQILPRQRPYSSVVSTVVPQSELPVLNSYWLRNVPDGL